MQKTKRAAVFETLEDRRLMYASIPADYTSLETIQIRPKAATYVSDLTLAKGTEYFIRATGEAYAAGKIYHGDAAFAAGTPVTTPLASSSSWGITATGVDTTDITLWGKYQSDHVYEERITPSSNGSLSFVFANDGLVTISTLAVTVYAPVPLVSVATERTNVASGSVNVNALPKGVVTIPVNNADFDDNGVADNQQSGRVVGDGFLLPITLPAVTGVATLAHYTIVAPPSFRVWTNADRTGSTAGIGIRETTAHTVYLEARKELPAGTTQSIQIQEIYNGVTIEQDIPVQTFSFAGASTAKAGSKELYSVDTAAGAFDGAVHGTLSGAVVLHTNSSQYTDVTWSSGAVLGYLDFRVNSSFIWGFPVQIET